MTGIDEAAVTGVLAHMNDDHADDSLVIVRAHGAHDALLATMTGVDAAGGTWRATDRDGTEHEVRVGRPGGPVSERGELRREVVAVFRSACETLGIEPPAH